MDTDRQRFKILFTEPHPLYTAQNIFLQYLQQQLGQRHLGGREGPDLGLSMTAGVTVSSGRCQQGTGLPGLEGTLMSH